MTTPFLVISVATTGLFTADYTPKLLEVAAVLVSPKEGRVASSSRPGRFACLVSHDAETFKAVQAQQAQDWHGITPELAASGFPEEEVCEAFKVWRKGLADILFGMNMSLGGWRAFNRDFVSSVLNTPEWEDALGSYGMPGRCVMEEASEVMGAHKVVAENWDGTFRYPSLKSTVRWLQGRDHKIPESTGRAQDNATTVGQVCLGLIKERQEAPERNVS